MGRKRDAARTTAILDAALELLNFVGYDKIRIQDIADRAGASIATVYRRWDSKEAVIAAALRSVDPEPLVTTGNPRQDLHEFIRGQAEGYSTNLDLFPGLIAATRTNHDLAAAVQETMVTHVEEPLRQLLTALFGPDLPHRQLVTDLAHALLLHRLALLGRTVEPDDFATEIVAAITAISGQPSTY